MEYILQKVEERMPMFVSLKEAADRLMVSTPQMRLHPESYPPVYVRDGGVSVRMLNLDLETFILTVGRFRSHAELAVEIRLDVERLKLRKEAEAERIKRVMEAEQEQIKAEREAEEAAIQRQKEVGAARLKQLQAEQEESLRYWAEVRRQKKEERAERKAAKLAEQAAQVAA